jgi:CubicO group peptidase (beta-lactamase class C family)
MKVMTALRARRCGVPVHLRLLLPLAGAMVVLALCAGGALAAADQAAAGAGRSPSRLQSWYEDNPTYFDSRDDSADWQFSSPEEQGMDPALLAAGGDSLAHEPSILSLLIVRHGRLVYERYYHGSARDQSNNVHSASKSMLQALISIAVTQGAIGSWDDRVSKYLPEYFTHAGASKRHLTIRQLMTMSSGLRWVEDRTEYAIQSRRDWVRAVLALRLRHRPGTHFNYSTGNTHVASAVLQRATGMKTSAFARKYLFDPLQITVEHWGRDPRGIDSGGYNVYMTPRELAKFGLLYAQGGVWRGRRVIPAVAVARAATRVWRVDALFNYSTGWWQRRLSGHDMFFGWGWGGQFVYVIPDLDVVMVTTENTADGHHNVEIDSGRLLRRFIIPSVTTRLGVRTPHDVAARWENW